MDDIEIHTTDQQFDPGVELLRITVAYLDEDDDSIHVDIHMHVNERCNPHHYADVFISALETVLANMRNAKRRLIAREIAERN